MHKNIVYLILYYISFLKHFFSVGGESFQAQDVSALRSGLGGDWSLSEEDS